MEVIKDPRTIVLAGLTLGWAGSTVYFYRNFNLIRADIQKIEDLLKSQNGVVATVNRHNKNFEEIKLILDKINAANEENLDAIDDMMETHREMDLYTQECLRLIVKSMNENEMKIELPPPPKVEYTTRKKKHRKHQRRQDRDDSDDERSHGRRQDRQDDARKAPIRQPARQPARQDSRADDKSRRRRRDDDSDSEDVETQAARYNR